MNPLSLKPKGPQELTSSFAISKLDKDLKKSIRAMNPYL
jgi:hypothetical protein